jgi:hypothetical protein
LIQQGEAKKALEVLQKPSVPVDLQVKVQPQGFGESKSFGFYSIRFFLSFYAMILFGTNASQFLRTNIYIQ